MSFTEKFYEMREEILAESLARMKAGAIEYAESDITKSMANLVGRDLLVEAEQECLGAINYLVAQIIKIRALGEAIEHDPVIQSVAPSGKPRKRTPT